MSPEKFDIRDHRSFYLAQYADKTIGESAEWLNEYIYPMLIRTHERARQELLDELRYVDAIHEWYFEEDE